MHSRTRQLRQPWTRIWQVGALRRRGREAAEMVRSEAEPEHLPKASTFHMLAGAVGGHVLLAASGVERRVNTVLMACQM